MKMTTTLAVIPQQTADAVLGTLQAADLTPDALAALVRAARAAHVETGDPVLVDLLALLDLFVEPAVAH